ncbi:transcriptional regulator, TetR family [Leptospira weilii serovar Ranarum str. ICFT]|uniref:Transcriptional regulator, TetR family n=2 Tax=Leptospira weilii TaxID=28184 RepID=N1WGF6_9LEPT|nr:transcriptional regulator, TetR family [Leptospira weilii serovar Ranarum str. ICFT]
MQESIELDSNWPEGQKKIFLAAIEIFAQKGFSATTTVEIAKKAGVAEGLIFKHFKSKKELLLSLVLPILESFFAPITLKRLGIIFSQEFSTLEQFLMAVFRERITFIGKNRNLVRIVLQEAFITTEIRAVLERVFKERLVPLFQERLKNFQERGMISEMPIESAFRLIGVNLSGYVLLTEVFYQPMAEDGWDQEAELNRTIAFIANGLAPKKQEVSVLKSQPKKKPPIRKTAAKAKKKKKKS